ncbi:MAG: FAS1-like dehydratase domain-containing protein [Geminicoccaceae bacterium]
MLPPEIEAAIDEWVARTRELTGKEVREREPWNSEVSADAIRHFVYGTDDDNPLWRDPEYAARTRHGRIMAPPAFLVSVLYPILHGAPMKAPLASLIGGVAYEWFERIHLGDRLRASSVQKDFYAKTSGSGRRLNFVISEVAYRDQDDRVVGKATGTMIMASQVGEQLQMERPIHRCSEEQLAELDRALKEEQRTGAKPLFLEDVEVGLEIPSIVRGPLTIGDMVAWNAAIGPSYKAGRWGHLDLQKSAHTAARNPVTGFSVKYSQQHEDFNLAAQRGMPGPFDNGVMRFAWVAPLITNWMGDDGFLGRLDVQVGQPGIYGDIQTYRGKVAGKDAGRGTARIEITGTNQEGEVSTRGEAEVVLPRR